MQKLANVSGVECREAEADTAGIILERQEFNYSQIVFEYTV